MAEHEITQRMCFLQSCWLDENGYVCSMSFRKLS